MSYPSLAISGLPGAGKTKLAERLYRDLGWEVYSLGGLWRARHQQVAPEVPFADWWRATSLEDNQAVDHQAHERIKKGQVIVEFRYSALCQDTSSCLRVYTHTDLSTRVDRCLGSPRYEHKMPVDIDTILRQREEDEVQMGRKLYGEDYDFRSPNHHALVLNTLRLTLDQEARLVLALIRP